MNTTQRRILAATATLIISIGLSILAAPPHAVADGRSLLIITVMLTGSLAFDHAEDGA